MLPVLQHLAISSGFLCGHFYLWVPARAPCASCLPWAWFTPSCPGSPAAALSSDSLWDLLLHAPRHKAGRWALRWWQGQRGTGCAEASLPQSEQEQTVKGGSGSFQPCFEEGRTCSLWKTLRFQSLGSELNIKLKIWKFHLKENYHQQWFLYLATITFSKCWHKPLWIVSDFWRRKETKKKKVGYREARHALDRPWLLFVRFS